MGKCYVLYTGVIKIQSQVIFISVVRKDSKEVDIICGTVIAQLDTCEDSYRFYTRITSAIFGVSAIRITR